MRGSGDEKARVPRQEMADFYTNRDSHSPRMRIDSLSHSLKYIDGCLSIIDVTDARAVCRCCLPRPEYKPTVYIIREASRISERSDYQRAHSTGERRPTQYRDCFLISEWLLDNLCRGPPPANGQERKYYAMARIRSGSLATNFHYYVVVRIQDSNNIAFGLNVRGELRTDLETAPVLFSS